jgi:hypothetical protein
MAVRLVGFSLNALAVWLGTKGKPEIAGPVAAAGSFLLMQVKPGMRPKKALTFPKEGE